MNECINSFGKAVVFSTLDGNREDRQIAIEKNDKDKTTFTSHHGLYQFVKMPFELFNAPGTFRCTMNVNLSSAKWQFVLVYFDAIVIFSKIPLQHTRNAWKSL